MKKRTDFRGGMSGALNSDMRRLHDVASLEPLTPAAVAEALWGSADDDAVRVVRWLAMLGANAAASTQSPPLVPLRTHLFFKGLQAATLCLSTRCPGHEEHRLQQNRLELRLAKSPITSSRSSSVSPT